jgi:hypothetical protein|tara:strand:+ start:3387 stop:4088 length:702 start_codon:yes stop_codon:yes gene_type:complete
MQFKTFLLNLFQDTFQRVEKLGNHKINTHGVWKSDYLLKNEKIFQMLSNKLDVYSETTKETFVVLPHKNYFEEWKNLKKILLENKNLLNTLNSFFGGRDWKVGPPSVWRLKPLMQKPDRQNRADGARFWHLDNIRHDYLKLFINLMDINDKHGPFRAIPANESKKIISIHKTKDRYDLKDKEFEAIKATGLMGTSTFCTTSRCLHRGGFQTEGLHRDMIQVHFVLKKPILGIL